MIPFNKPYLTGKETSHLTEAVETGKLSETGSLQKNANISLRILLNLKRLY